MPSQRQYGIKDFNNELKQFAKIINPNHNNCEISLIKNNENFQIIKKQAESSEKNNLNFDSFIEEKILSIPAFSLTKIIDLIKEEIKSESFSSLYPNSFLPKLDHMKYLYTKIHKQYLGADISYVFTNPLTLSGQP